MQWKKEETEKGHVEAAHGVYLPTYLPTYGILVIQPLQVSAPQQVDVAIGDITLGLLNLGQDELQL